MIIGKLIGNFVLFQGDLHDRATICELHFVPSDYSSAPGDPNTPNRKRLHKNAVPTVNPPKNLNRKVFHDDTIQPKTTLIGKAYQPSHCLVKIVDRTSQICKLCHKNAQFRCEANLCKVELCLSPCFANCK